MSTLNETFSRYEYSFILHEPDYFDHEDVISGGFFEDTGLEAQWMYYTEHMWLLVDCLTEK